MVIAFVSDAIYPYNKGGKEKRLYELSTRLAAMGNEVHIYTMKWWSGPKEIIEDDVHLHAIGKHYPLYKGDKRSINEGVIFGLACLRLLFEDFDLIDVDHMPFFPLFTTKFVCIIKRKKMVGTWNEVWGRSYWVKYMGFLGNIAALLELASIRLPKEIVAISPHTRERIETVLHRKRNITFIPPGIKYQEISKVKRSLESFDLIAACRLLKHKNVDILIQAVNRLKKEGISVTCLIVGEGPEKEHLNDLVKSLRLGNQIIIRDFYQRHNDLYSLIKSSKIFVSPSSREGFGIVAIEANACGVPVITNSEKDNATKDIIKEGYNGFQFNKTSASLAKAIKKGLASRSDKIGSDCKEHAKHYDWGKIVEQFERLYGL